MSNWMPADRLDMLLRVENNLNNLFDLSRIIKFQMNMLIRKSVQDDSNNLILFI